MVVVSVSGISGAGKTTISKALCKQLEHAVALYFDDYEFRRQPDDIGEWIENGSDADAWDFSLLEADIEQIMQLKQYDYLILDYPFGKSEYSIKKYIDFAVYIDTPLDICLARRMIRDYRFASTSDIMSALSSYLNKSRKYYILSESGIKAFDLVIDGMLTTDAMTAKIIKVLTSREDNT
ncbi:Uridine kinase [bioreactor metagenome]|uniref:Uridine kinase n=1 Tax=bioreactor metagenome TaxID=1076179 RepID=A0A645CMG6_9ZZZZ